MWSSTYVRTCVAAGDVAGAAEALGRPHAVAGVVVEGDKRGRELGFPTANVPQSGWLRARRRRVRRLAAPARRPPRRTPRRSASAPTRRSTACGIAGSRPTCSTATDLDLYGVEVEVAFVDRLRGQVRFDAIDALVVRCTRTSSATRDLLLTRRDDGAGAASATPRRGSPPTGCRASSTRSAREVRAR